MTTQEIQQTLAKIKANSAIPEKQKGMLVAKYEKMLESSGEITPAPKKAPSKAPKKAKIREIADADSRIIIGKPEPLTEKTSNKGEYDCDELIAKVRQQKAKAKARAEQKANEPKKTTATKNRDAVEKVAEKVTANVEKRIDSKKVSISEIEKLIEGAKQYLTTLEDILSKAKNAGIMAKGGHVSNEMYSNLVNEAKSIKVGHCGCSGNKYAKGGEVDEVIEFSDGYQFKRVSKDWAKKNWDKREVYAINLDDETERLIEDGSELNDFQDFGIEML